MRLVVGLFRSLRPRQWTKNLLVFAALLFAQKATDPDAVIHAFETFVIFCALAGAMYLINDCMDIERDRLDPVKRNRPLACGILPVPVAVVAAIVLVGGALAWAVLLAPPLLFEICVAYVVITLSYSFLLKHVLIVDVFCIASGFVLRAVAGAAAIEAEISPWLVICTLLLSLFLALAKRRGELMTLGEDASAHRSILAEYSPQLLDQMISVVTSSTVMSYALYTISDRTVREVGSTNLLYTIPFVIYGIFRYLYLVHEKGFGGHPERALLRDRPLMINILLYALVAGLIIYLR